MPLITNNILQARAAYAGLELRVAASQQAVTTLQATVDHLSSVHAGLVDSVFEQGKFTATQVATNGTLTANQATAVSPEISLDNFIASLGLSIALAEATMPDRTINSVSATVQSFLTFAIGPDGKTQVPGLRLYQPELGAPTALATTSFDLSKTASTPGTAAPRSLYTVLMAKQTLFANPFWSKFSSGNTPVTPAQQIVVETTKIFSMIGSWSFSYVLTEATALAGLETALAGMVLSVLALQGATASTALTARGAAYTAGVAALAALTQSIAGRTMHVAGDLYALSAALDATTNLAAVLLP